MASRLTFPALVVFGVLCLALASLRQQAMADPPCPNVGLIEGVCHSAQDSGNILYLPCAQQPRNAGQTCSSAAPITNAQDNKWQTKTVNNSSVQENQQQPIVLCYVRHNCRPVMFGECEDYSTENIMQQNFSNVDCGIHVPPGGGD